MSDAEVRSGQAIYNPLVLRLYDVLVLDVSNTLVWRCPKQRILRMYDSNVTGEHLDVGVGSGFYLDKCRFPVERPRITLVDLNPNALAFAARRIARYEVRTHRANVLAPLGLPEASHGSASLGYLLHCVPGDMRAKAVVLSHVAAAVRSGGTVFGSTIVAEGGSIGSAARFVMGRYNARGIFHNSHDSADVLDAELGARFASHRLTVQGCVALFEAQVA
jgi:hypothetical protein